MSLEKTKKILIWIFILAIIIIIGLFGFYQIKKFNLNKKDPVIREQAAAGSFYPANKLVLNQTIDNFLNQKYNKVSNKKVLGLILPHAGYQFSGKTLAQGIKHLANQNIKRVVILANSHQKYFNGVSTYLGDYYKTPLGKIAVDKAFVKRLINSSSKINYFSSAHKNEHSIEVELPFLQKVIKNDFKIVPVLFGNKDKASFKEIASFLTKNYTKETIFIASSDLSHYPEKKLAEKLDQKTINLILQGDTNNFEKQTHILKDKYSVSTLACAKDAIKALMIISNNLKAESKLINYTNSGDSTNSKKVVGYTAIGFFKEKDEFLLNEKQKKTLKEIAKKSVYQFVKNKTVPEFKIKDPLLNKNVGAFVTLKKQGQLRGCIGRFSPTKKPLFQVVQDMAIAASSYDKRFQPVSASELSQLSYEISVLSPMQEVDSLNEIILGKHGVFIKKDNKSGVFLPQVAVDNNWGINKFMSQLCLQKAGLSKDCYKDKDLTIKVFNAQVF